MFIHFKNKIKLFCQQSLKVGFFLGYNQIKRANKWTNFFIILIMLFTFLNLIVINGILVGLIEGSSRAYRSNYSGDIFITKPENKNFIKNGKEILDNLEKNENIYDFSPRYLSGGIVLADFFEKIVPPEKQNQVSANIVGIDPEKEDQTTRLSKLIVEGEYLNNDDRKYILIGSSLLDRYSRGVPGLSTIKNVSVGDKVKLKVGSSEKEFIIKGVVKSKIGDVGSRVYVLDSYLRKIIGRQDGEVQEIAIKIKDERKIFTVKDQIIKSGVDNNFALVQVWQESQGKFFKDIASTFNILGTLIGLIGLTVSSITIFIVIFINAINRKKYIGIMKGIGICSSAIKISYIMQSLFYSFLGTALGLIILFGFLEPYISANPINFPFSDGILAISTLDLLFKIGLLFFVTVVAGYIPANIIVKKNTLDSILGR